MEFSYDAWKAADDALDEAIHWGDPKEIATANKKLKEIHQKEEQLEQDEEES